MYKRKKWVTTLALMGLLTVPAQSILTYAQQPAEGESQVVSESETPTPPVESETPPPVESETTPPVESETPPVESETAPPSESSEAPIESETPSSETDETESSDESDESDEESEESDETKEPTAEDIEWIEVEFELGIGDDDLPVMLKLRYPNYIKFFDEFKGKHIPETFMVTDFEEMYDLERYISLNVKELGDYHYVDQNGETALKPEFKKYLYTKQEWDFILEDNASMGLVYDEETGEFNNPNFGLTNDLDQNGVVTEMDPDPNTKPVSIAEVRDYTQAEIDGYSLSELAYITGYREIKSHVMGVGAVQSGQFINGTPYTITRMSDTESIIEYEQFGLIDKTIYHTDGVGQLEVVIKEGSTDHPTLIFITDSQDVNYTQLKFGTMFYMFNNIHEEDPNKQYLVDLVIDAPITPPVTEEPSESEPDESTPDESTPSESEPVESTPDESTPSEETPDESTPSEETPDEDTPDESTPSEETPEESTPSESTPSESTPDESNPSESTPSESTPVIDDEDSGNTDTDGGSNTNQPNESTPTNNNTGNSNTGGGSNSDQPQPNASDQNDTGNQGSLESTGIGAPILGVAIATLLATVGGFMFVASSKQTKKNKEVADE